MSKFREMVEAKLSESKLQESFRIDDLTREYLRELYKEILDAKKFNDKAIEGAQAHDIFVTSAAVEGFTEEYNKIKRTLVEKIFDGMGTDYLHHQIEREIRQHLYDHPEVVKELESVDVENAIDFETFHKRTRNSYNHDLSNPAKQLLRLEKTLKYIRYIGSVRSYLGLSYGNTTNFNSMVGKYIDDLKISKNNNDPGKLIATVNASGRDVTGNLDHALEALKALGERVFPSDKNASIPQYND